jgi:hypothetical protein
MCARTALFSVCGTLEMFCNDIHVPVVPCLDAALLLIHKLRIRVAGARTGYLGDKEWQTATEYLFNDILLLGFQRFQQSPVDSLGGVFGQSHVLAELEQQAGHVYWRDVLDTHFGCHAGQSHFQQICPNWKFKSLFI